MVVDTVCLALAVDEREEEMTRMILMVRRLRSRRSRRRTIKMD